MPPLAGKPPYATDEPDSAFGPPQQPQRRMRQPAPEDPNKRTSAYDVWVAQFSPVYYCVNIWYSQIRQLHQEGRASSVTP